MPLPVWPVIYTDQDGSRWREVTVRERSDLEHYPATSSLVTRWIYPHGRPDGILCVRCDETQEDVQRRRHDGWREALDGMERSRDRWRDALRVDDYQPFYTGREVEDRERTRAQIAGSFGIPPALLGSDRIDSVMGFPVYVSPHVPGDQILFLGDRLLVGPGVRGDGFVRRAEAVIEVERTRSLFSKQRPVAELVEELKEKAQSTGRAIRIREDEE